MRPPSPSARALFAPALLTLTAAACDRKEQPAPPPATSVAAASASAAPAKASASPFHLALESKAPVAFSGLAGGVWVGHSALAQAAQALGAEDLEEKPMPPGLPEAPGRPLGAAGRLPNALWLSLEQPRADGKAGAGPTPLYRLGRDGFKRFAEDWQPQIAAWSKNRLIAASTSSGQLKIKVIEPQLKDAPPDLPAARFGDEACAKSFKLRQLAALPSGEAFAAGNCSPEGAQGTRYVVIRWPAPDAPGGEAGAARAATSAASPAPPSPPSAAAPPSAAPAAPGASAVAASSAGATTAVAPAASTTTAAAPGASATTIAPGASTTTTATAGAGVPAAAGAEAGIAGSLFVIPGSERNLAHRALFVRGAGEAYVAAVDEGRRTSTLARFDGAEWAAEPPPPTPETIQSLAGAGDGTLWALTEHHIWRRPPAGVWAEVPAPEGAFADAEASWDYQSVWASGDDVWVAGRQASKGEARHVVLRLKAPRAALHWP